MFRVKSRYGSDEVDICASLVVVLVQMGAVRLKKARWPVDILEGEARVAYVRMDDVASISPVRALTGCRCDEHGYSCP